MCEISMALMDSRDWVEISWRDCQHCSSFSIAWLVVKMLLKKPTFSNWTQEWEQEWDAWRFKAVLSERFLLYPLKVQN